MRKDFPTAVLVAIMIMFICGALLTYPLNTNEFRAEATDDGTAVRVDMESSVESAYSVFSVNLRNGPIERTLYTYYDESYESPLSLDNQQYRIEEIEEHLRYLDKENIKIDAEELKNIIVDTANAEKYSILMVSGAFPSNVYSYEDSTHTLTDLVTSWINAGGAIFWYCTQEFGYYSAPLKEEFIDWETNQPLTDNPYGFNYEDSITYATERSEISKELTLTQNICDTYSVKGDSPDIINLGYESEDGRYSIAMAERGDGRIVINGGPWTNDMCMAKIIASAVYDWTTLSPEHEEGTFKGHKSLEFTTGADAVFVYMGTITPRYGDLFLLLP